MGMESSCIDEVSADSETLTLTPPAVVPLQRMGSGTSTVLDPVLLEVGAEVESRKLPSSQYKGVVPQPNGRWGAQIYERHQRVWLGTFGHQAEAARAYDLAAQRFRGRDAVTNFKPLSESDEAGAAELSFLAAHSKAEIVDMLRKHTYYDELKQSRRAMQGVGKCVVSKRPSLPGSFMGSARQLLFDKVVTPSDVGKLNRLVIPKQHAEKHFPIKDANGLSACKGVLLNFEDADGKVWRFRYSYWNSSQSYVLTKGWSRFVKEKSMRAGDVVRFWRSSNGSEKQLYIDCKPRSVIGGCVLQQSILHNPPVVKLFGVNILEAQVEGRKREREMELFPHYEMLCKKK